MNEANEEMLKGLFIFMANHVSVEKKKLDEAKAAGKLEQAALKLVARVGTLEAFVHIVETTFPAVLARLADAESLEEVQVLLREAAGALALGSAMANTDGFDAAVEEFRKQATAPTEKTF